MGSKPTYLIRNENIQSGATPCSQCCTLSLLCRPLLLLQWVFSYVRFFFLSLSSNGFASFWMECGSSCLLLISDILISVLLLVLVHLLFVVHQRLAPFCPTFHVLLSIQLDLQALLNASRLPKVGLLFCSLPGGATIMSTTNTPSHSRSHNTSFVILFSMYDPDVSHRTLFPFLTIFETDLSAMWTFATWKVIFLRCVPSDVDLINVFSP